MKQLNLLDMKTKRCTKCGEVKPVSEFYKNESKKGRLESRCKKCAKENAKRYRENNPKKIKESQKKIQQKNKEKHTDEYYQNLSGIKRCDKCKKIKDVSNFSKNRIRKDGLCNECKECRNAYKKNWRKNNPEYIKKWRKDNVKHVKEYSKNYRKNNAEYRKKYMKEWYKNNPEYGKKHFQNNKEKYRKNNKNYRKNNPEKTKEYDKKRMSVPKNRLSNNISSAIGRSLKNGKKGNHWEDLVDFTLQTLRPHLKSQFKPGMNWNNYGRNGWEIDHIKPIASFNFTSYKDKEFKECWALENLQPLWDFENNSKGAKY